MEKTSPEELEVFLKVEGRVLCQLLLENLEKLKHTEAFKGALKVKVNDLYQMLDKSTKNYDEMYKATPEGTNLVYDIVERNVHIMHSFIIPEKNILNGMIAAYNMNEKAVQGIVDKVLTTKK